MPADLSKSAQGRRPVRRDAEGSKGDGNYAREIEMKRNRGEISCAECRRLKIKCDKQIPCSLATGQGTRFVIAATEHLHRRITRMSDRIRQLEDALAVLQSSHSSEQHPLLRDGLLFLDQDRFEEHPSAENEDGEVSKDVVNAFGTMSISEHGVSRFFGPTGGSEGLLLIDQDEPANSPSSTNHTDSSSRDSKSPKLSSTINRFSKAFPFSPVGSTDEVITMIHRCLPTWEMATSICETFLENAAWLFRGVSRIQLMEEILPSIYGKAVDPVDDYSGPHDLALLLSIFSVGRIVDITLSPDVAEADGEHWNQLAMAALCLKPVLEKPSMVTIQVLHMASIFNAMSGSEAINGESTMETTWSLIGLAAHLSQSMGLHRDSARWESSPRIVQRRRVLFWDLFVADAWHCLSTGRPPSFSRDYIDCQFPQDDEMTLNDGGETEPGFGSWGFRFAYECVAEVAARTLTVTPTRYSDILDLDRKIRDFSIPSEALAMLRGEPGTDPRSVPLSASMAHFVLSHTREVILLFIHRSFFAQALIEDPVNPIRSPYAQSFLSTVRAASTILRCVRDQFTIYPAICSRFWSTWTYAFSAAVVFGVIVTRGPRSHLADSAIVELDQACDLFSQAAKLNRRAAKAHTILSRLQDKAHRVLEASKSEKPRLSGEDGAAWDIKQEEIDDELSIFAGRTMILRAGASASSSQSQNTSLETTDMSPAPLDMVQSQPGSGLVEPSQLSAYGFEGRGPANTSTMRDWLAQSGQGYQQNYYSQSQSQPQPQPDSQGTVSMQPIQYGQPLVDNSRPMISTPPHRDIPISHPHSHRLHLQSYMTPTSYAEPPSVNHHQPQPSYSYGVSHMAHMSQDNRVQGGGLHFGYGQNANIQPEPELTDLGLAATNSRLNDNWTYFMQNSGILDNRTM
ncbi:hypothetical protein EW146_g4238 [Bondarzewia mesenterica]|uniref:Xylanolytic transcriptional activator regulatory domain-containing protein n=1 Tax=Bondarzewia mesenterica TaxID=1095465 RepID=A0A4S4LXC5_9AGAM|nr:hypothetical protein EW146_g4238 [Bondarzewia mesenterica]